MTDDKGAGEGPYKYVIESGDDLIISSEGLESVVVFCNEIKGLYPDDVCVKIANKAYVYGRKAERERCLNVLKKYPDDGKELGDILEAIRLEIKGLI